MIELLILYILDKHSFTMYGISKEIQNIFAVYTAPSFGSIKPALRKLEFEDYISSNKVMSDGGKLSVFYSITKKGEKELKILIKKELSNNPVQFIQNAKIKLSMADLLDFQDRAELFLHIKTLAQTHKRSAENILNNDYIKKNFYQRILLDNSIVSYSNFITLVEGLEKDNAGNR